MTTDGICTHSAGNQSSQCINPSPLICDNLIISFLGTFRVWPCQCVRLAVHLPHFHLHITQVVVFSVSSVTEFNMKRKANLGLPYKLISESEDGTMGISIKFVFLLLYIKNCLNDIENSCTSRRVRYLLKKQKKFKFLFVFLVLLGWDHCFFTAAKKKFKF